MPGIEFRSLRYVYGHGPFALTVTDIFGNCQPITAAEAAGLPEYCAFDDYRFKQMIDGVLAARRAGKPRQTET